MDYLTQLLKDLPNWFDILRGGLHDTLVMTVVSTVLSYVIGLPLGVLLTVTKPGGISPKPTFNAILGWIINMLRSIPFIILMISLLPLTRLVLGTSIGPIAASLPLVIGAAPFVARLVESSLEELDKGLLEASQAMGATTWQIIYKIMLPEVKPSLIRGVSITTITLIGYSAMAGTVGAGGLGYLAISYGYQRFKPNVIVYTVILLIILVQIIQIGFNLTAKLVDKRNR